MLFILGFADDTNIFVRFRVSLFFCSSVSHATQRMAGCGSASGIVRSDRRPSSPISVIASLNAWGSVASALVCRSSARSEAPCSSGCASEVSCVARSTEISGGDSSECPGFHHPIVESFCILGRVRRDCSRSLEGFLKRARQFKFVRICSSCSEASFSSRGGGDRSCGVSPPHEGGVRRVPTQISKSASKTHLHEFLRWRRKKPKSANCGNMWPSWNGPVLHKSVLVCASVCPRFQGLGFYRPCRQSSQVSSSHGWRIVRQISKRRGSQEIRHVCWS